MKPARAACLASAGIASSRLPSTTSTSAISSGTLARSFSMCGGTKWIMRSSLPGTARSGAGAPVASGLKKLRGSFICLIPRRKRGVLDDGMKERPGLAKRFYKQARKWMSASAAARLLEREGKLLVFGLSGVAVENRKLPAATHDFAVRLLRRDIGLPDHLTPELRLLDEELRRLPAAFGDGLHLNSARLFGHVRPSEDFDQIAIDLVGQDRRRLRRRDHGVPSDSPVTRPARPSNSAN